MVYAEKDSKIKLILRPLPDLGWEVDGDRISFDERPNWLPGLDKLRNWLRDSEGLFRGIAELKSMESVQAASSRSANGTNSLR